MTERVWDQFLTQQDKAHLAASPATGRYGFGERPAVLSVDNYRKAVGDQPEPLLQSVRTWPSSTGLAGWEALKHISGLLGAARAAGVPIIHVTGLGQDASGMPGWGSRIGGRHAARRRTPEEDERHRRGLDFVAEAAPLDGEPVFRKTAPSAFFGTPLIAHLVAERIDTLIVCGQTVSGCVRATVVDGCSMRLRMIVVEECVYDRHEASRAINLFDMDQKYADVVSVDEVTARFAEEDV